jgi:hypothetical protein
VGARQQRVAPYYAAIADAMEMRRDHSLYSFRGGASELRAKTPTAMCHDWIAYY